MRNLYDILGVSKNATIEEINKARIKLSRELHPDVTGGDVQAQEQLKEINAAYSVLKNSEARAKYGRESALQTNRPTERNQSRPQTVDDIISKSPMGRMWNQMMGEKPTAEQQRQAQANADAEKAKINRMEEKDETRQWLNGLGKESPFNQHLSDSGFQHFSDLGKKPNIPEMRPMSGWKDPNKVVKTEPTQAEKDEFTRRMSQRDTGENSREKKR